MRSSNITITTEASSRIPYEESKTKKLIKQLCSRFNLGSSSFARLSVTDDELVIVTSYGSLIPDNQLTDAYRHQGNPKGRVTAKKSASGHR
ncbi:MAG: hypothetical protein ACI92I_000188 [Acidimicrobiales bacterium]|jgi:hypothetical protein